MLDMFKLAGKVAIPTVPDDARNYWIGCVGIRDDGVIVSSKNGSVFSTMIEDYQLLPESHAEGRVLRKLGKNGIIYVTRVSKSNGGYAMARPCGMCQIRIRSFKVKKVFYTINENQFGVWYPNSDVDKIFNCKDK